MRRLLLAAVLGTGLLLVPAASLADTPFPHVWVYTYGQSLGDTPEVDLAVDLPQPAPLPATVTFTVPAGYAATLSGSVGEPLGDAEVDIAPVGGSTTTTKLRGKTIVADPAAFAADPHAQACAPGTHLAVWSLDLGGAGSIPVAVDALPSGGSYLITVCISALQRPGFAPVYLEEDFDSVFQNPRTQGTYWWIARVTPSDATGAPNPAATYELQGGEPLPEPVTLVASWNAKKHVLTARGAVRGGGKPRADIRVHLNGGTSDDPGSMHQIGIAYTNSSGAYAFTARLSKKPKWMYGEVWSYYGEQCPLPASAPAGCAGWTIDGSDSLIVAVR